MHRAHLGVDHRVLVLCTVMVCRCRAPAEALSLVTERAGFFCCEGWISLGIVFVCRVFSD